MRVVQMQSEADLRALKPAWDALLRESAANTIFLTWEWVTAWWSVYGLSLIHISEPTRP